MGGKGVKTVANVSGRDLAEFLPLAAEIPLKPEVQLYRLEEANAALTELKYGDIRGANVLQIQQLVQEPVLGDLRQTMLFIIDLKRIQNK